jgi:septal ring factor EnvC (AmiA/AmiB activator)
MLRRIGILAAAVTAIAAAALAAQPGALDLRGELAASEQARSESRQEAQDLRRDIQALQAQLDELKAIEANEEKVTGGKRARLDALNAREAELSGQMGANQVELARLLGALELYRREPPPALLVTPGSARDAVRAAILIEAVTPELERRAAVFRQRAEALRLLRRATAAASEDLFTSESARADKRAEIERLVADKTALETRLNADAATAGRTVEALTAKMKALGIDTNVPPPTVQTGPAPTALLPPVRGVLVHRFGDRSQGAQRSDGLTWRAPPSAIVTAPAAGVVEYAGALKGWGGVVIVRIGGGYHLVLAGLDAISAVQGRPVAAGQGIGRMAESGEPELYLEARRSGEPVDPGRWVRQAR